MLSLCWVPKWDPKGGAVSGVALFANENLMEDNAHCRLKLVDPTSVSVEEKPSEAFADTVVFPLRHLREQAEIKAIQSALKLTGWNRTRASRLLKISYRGLLYKIRRHDIRPA
jgi:transcriptional regulator with GAF, ATPase, and Fis domain